MARVSFTLRRSDADLGSSLRHDDAVAYDTSGSGGSAACMGPGSRTDVDSALRQDALQLAPTTFEESYFEIRSSCYGEVELDWQVSVQDAASAEPTVTGVVVVYSAQGEPQTIASGDILVESTSTFEHVHTGLPEGRWAYYSLFVHYTSTGGDDYYERVGSLRTLVVKDYGSTMQLWNRIPEYYRNKDIELGTEVPPDHCLGNEIPAGNVVGPLFKYLSVFGFEMDRMRSLIDYIMVSRDPELAETDTLDALAHMTGVGLRTSDLGSQRLRNLMDHVGYFRRSKGTLGSIEFMIKSVSGCDITIDETLQEITMYSQRVNYITDPEDGTGIVTYRAATEAEETTPLDFSDVTSAAYDGDIDYASTVFSHNTTPTVPGVIIHIDSIVPVRLGDRVVFSVHAGTATSMKWARVVDASENELGISLTQTTVDGSPGYEVLITDATNTNVETYTDAYVEIYVDLEESTTFTLANMLAELNRKGIYFDGSLTRGGWLLSSSAPSISDYRWAGSAFDSVSLYTEDYERTKHIVNAILPEVLPITQADDYTIISYNAVPGF
jgi:hypothetical protein